MTSRNHRFLRHACLPVAVSLACTAGALAADLPEDVFAVVNGEEIKLATIEHIMRNNGIPMEQQQLEQVIEQVVANTALAQEARKNGYLERPEVQLEIELSRELVLGRAYLRDFMANSPIEENDIEAEFKRLAAEAEGGREYRARHILVSNEQEALEIIKSANGDPDTFSELAKSQSLDSGSGANGGDLGWTAPEAFVPEFSAAMVALEPGQFSEPVQSQFGWHVIYLDNTRELPTPTLDTAMRQRITDQLRQAALREEYRRLLDSADVDLNEKMIFGDEDAAATSSGSDDDS